MEPYRHKKHSIMKTRILTLSALILLGFSNQGFTQAPAGLPENLRAGLKTDIVGSYPQEIWEYNWVVEYWMVFQKKYISYTSFGEPSEITVIGLGGESRTLYSYNNQGLLVQTLEQDKTGNNWVDNRRETNEYTNEGFIRLGIIENWNGSGWVMEYGIEYSYSFNQDRIITYLTRLWDRESGDWINSSRTAFSYGTSNVLEAITETWLGDAWINSSKIRYVYDGENVAEMYLSGWLDNDWVESTKMVYEYGDNDSWTMTYYSGPGNGTWSPSQRFINNYDSHGNAILTTIEFYAGDWMMLSGTKYLLTYDGSNLTERITQVYSATEPGNEKSVSTMGWRNVLKEEFKDFASLSVDPVIKGIESVSIFPNPAREEVHLNINNFRNKKLTVVLMNLNGQVNFTGQLVVPTDRYSYTINLDAMPSGLFFVLVKDESGTIVSISKLLHQQ